MAGGGLGGDAIGSQNGNSTLEKPANRKFLPVLLPPTKVNRTSNVETSSNVIKTDRSRCRSIMSCGFIGLSAPMPVSVEQYTGDASVCVSQNIDPGGRASMMPRSAGSISSSSPFSRAVRLKCRAWSSVVGETPTLDTLPRICMHSLRVLDPSKS